MGVWGEWGCGGGGGGGRGQQHAMRDTVGKNMEWMKNELASHSDYKNEMCMIEHFWRQKGHICVFLPKFHPDLYRQPRTCVRVWTQLKRYTKCHCKYTLPSLPLAYDSVSQENIKNHFRKVRHYMFAYMEGLTPGQLNGTLKKYKKRT